jgi:hypothetical protein
MNDDRLDRLFKAARTIRADTARMEVGFETRLLARLRSERDQFFPWYAFAWRLIPVFALIVVAAGVWTIVAPRSSRTDIRNAIADDEGERTLVTYFTGE